MTTQQSRQPLWLGIALVAIMAATRGSHIGSSALLPDATLATMLLGGIWLKRVSWFGLMIAVAVAVDAFAVGVAGVSSYCLSPAYVGLLPTYAVLWLGGRWLAKRGDAFAPLAYVAVALVTITLAFLISTDSFYLFSGRYPGASLFEVVQHGWEYYPAYLGYTLMYLAVAWVAHRAAIALAAVRQSQSA